ncbi:MAG: YggS family pyridoxal phosphate-dependent enzyme, partial [Phycisphaerae bacterium]|nr:YggS family pyridoxal phosphate-dependent enzyme [Phycisphaerae bacterium]
MLSLALVTPLRKRIEKNLRRIEDTIAAACARRGRSEREVSLVAVTKSVGIEAIAAAVDVGLTDLGENRVQRLTERAAELEAVLQRRRSARARGVRWHMVGHLQRNKVRAVLDVARVIHSVDSLRLAEAINARAEQAEMVVDVLVQVNCSQEPQKFGVAVGAAAYLGELVSTLRHLRLTGLMTMAVQSRNPEKARPSFVRLRELFEEMRRDGIGG